MYTESDAYHISLFYTFECVNLAAIRTVKTWCICSKNSYAKKHCRASFWIVLFPKQVTLVMLLVASRHSTV